MKRPNPYARMRLATRPRPEGQAGYAFVLYCDGHMTAEHYSPWTGESTGGEYATPPGYANIHGCLGGAPVRGAEDALAEAIDKDPDPAQAARAGRGWTQTKASHVRR